MVGSGRAHAAQITDLARANMEDKFDSQACGAIASLGGFGKFPGNEERDLHRWLHELNGVQLRPYEVTMELNAS